MQCLDPVIAKRIPQIQLLILDVDGVLTDGSLYFSDKGDEMKRFHVHDGLGIKRVQQAGITVAVISSRQSAAVTQRLTALGVQHILQGATCKLTTYEQLLQTVSIAPEQIAYMGDDLPDLPVMQKIGFAVAPPQAVDAVKAVA